MDVQTDITHSLTHGRLFSSIDGESGAACALHIADRPPLEITHVTTPESNIHFTSF